jgi:phenylalanyl-tRNA synthetase alpha chain
MNNNNRVLAELSFNVISQLADTTSQISQFGLELEQKLTSKNTINIPDSIIKIIGRNLHLTNNHPICIIKNLIHDYFKSKSILDVNGIFNTYDDINPVVSTKNNFDLLLIPVDHMARSKSDTYYVNENQVLRTHTSAHQNDILSNVSTSFLVTGDVYRKDEIDSTHYPVFHQMEGVFIDVENKLPDKKQLDDNLIEVLKGLCNHLFPESPVRITPDYFPFTNPSFQMEVHHKGKWIEILGCGIIQPDIIKHCAMYNETLVFESLKLKKGWAFGLGLDRLAMILFEIPDIRYMWVNDPKFINQFKSDMITKFEPYSVLDEICRDVSFYIEDPNSVIENPWYVIEDVEKFTDSKTNIVRIWNHENDMCEVIRETGNGAYPDIIAKVHMFDQFYNPKLQKLSRAYRIHYSPPDSKMTDPGSFTVLVNKLHTLIAQELEKKLNVKVR